jgi:hypothetical protein
MTASTGPSLPSQLASMTHPGGEPDGHPHASLTVRKRAVRVSERGTPGRWGRGGVLGISVHKTSHRPSQGCLAGNEIGGIGTKKTPSIECDQHSILRRQNRPKQHRKGRWNEHRENRPQGREPQQFTEH